MFVERFARRRRRRLDATGDTERMALLQISEPGGVARSAPAPHRRRHRPRHDAFAGRRGAPRRGRVPARRAGRRDPAVGGALPAPAARRADRPRALADAAERPAQHHRLGQALHGPRPGRHRRAATRCRTLRRRARHGAARDRAGVKSPVEVSAEILATLRQRAEDTFDDELFGAVITVPAYFDDAQRQATKDAARARRPERAAPDQRADRRGDRLRSRQRAARASTPSTTSAAAPSTSRCCA